MSNIHDVVRQAITDIIAGRNITALEGLRNGLSDSITKDTQNIEKELHIALWMLSGTDDLTPKIERALRVAIEMAYESGKVGLLSATGNDCVKAFTEELGKQ